MTDPAFYVVIPARFASTRLPGKPLLDIAGRPMIQHVWEQACRSQAQGVLIATDDARIATVCQQFGAEVALTATHHRSGSDRIAEVCAQRGWADATVVVNAQGDEPCLPPALIDQAATTVLAQPQSNMATLCYPITTAAQLLDPNVVKVVLDAAGRALYFSRAPIPWPREAWPHPLGASSAAVTPLPADAVYWRHVGVYAYRVGFLQRYVTWAAAPLEQSEALEQLRALWHGESIQVAIAAVEPGIGVDTAADLALVRHYLATAR